MINVRLTLSLKYKRLKRSEEHTSELQSRPHLVCRLLLEKKNLRQLVAHGLIVEGGEPGKELGGNSHVHSTLLVGFFRHGAHAAAGASELACDPGQVDQLQ